MIELTHEPIDIQRVLAHVTDPQCGAEVLFVGTTRQWTMRQGTTHQGTQTPHDDQQPSKASDALGAPAPLETSHLVYEAYAEMALARMHDLGAHARARWPVQRVAIVHRLGRVDPTEASVAIAVSCPHRREAFEAASWLIEQLKHEVPIWKQEHYVQSAAQWIHPTAGNCNCTTDVAQPLQPTIQDGTSQHHAQETQQP